MAKRKRKSRKVKPLVELRVEEQLEDIRRFLEVTGAVLGDQDFLDYVSKCLTIVYYDGVIDTAKRGFLK